MGLVQGLFEASMTQMVVQDAIVEVGIVPVE